MYSATSTPSSYSLYNYIIHTQWSIPPFDQSRIYGPLIMSYSSDRKSTPNRHIFRAKTAHLHSVIIPRIHFLAVVPLRPDDMIWRLHSLKEELHKELGYAVAQKPYAPSQRRGTLAVLLHVLKALLSCTHIYPVLSHLAGRAFCFPVLLTAASFATFYSRKSETERSGQYKGKGRATSNDVGVYCNA